MSAPIPDRAGRPGPIPSPAPAPVTCPRCEGTATRVVEDVSDEVTVFGCEACGATWADRTGRGMG